MNFKFDDSKVFFTSDTHFYHGNIIRFCNRPFKDVDMMNETIISNWNNTVGQDDIVFHLGDFCLGGSAEWTRMLDRLNGRIYLIMGNHDLKKVTIYDITLNSTTTNSSATANFPSIRHVAYQ